MTNLACVIGGEAWYPVPPSPVFGPLPSELGASLTQLQSPVFFAVAATSYALHVLHASKVQMMHAFTALRCKYSMLQAFGNSKGVQASGHCKSAPLTASLAAHSSTYMACFSQGKGAHITPSLSVFMPSKQAGCLRTVIVGLGDICMGLQSSVTASHRIPSHRTSGNGQCSTHSNLRNYQHPQPHRPNPFHPLAHMTYHTVTLQEEPLHTEHWRLLHT